MAVTSRLQLPYPVPTDTADVPRDMEALADKIDVDAAIYLQGTMAARPAAQIPGRFYYATDERTVSYDTGTEWAAVVAGGAAPALTQAPVLDVGMASQIRAGRRLAVADFTALGLNAPIGLWNLGDVNDASGNNNHLTNKGAVPFGVGINGLAATAAVFAGSTGQALYRADAGAADPLRIRTGSWGCWFRTAKRATQQSLLGKNGVSAAVSTFSTGIGTDNLPFCVVGDGATQVVTTGVTDVCDDRWHLVVCVSDGTVARLYVDGALEAVRAAVTLNATPTAPLNVGGYGADAATAAGLPLYGRVDEAFVTADVLSEDQVRALYCAKIAHGFAGTPSRVTLNVIRRKRGGSLAPLDDFPAQPIRLHNFTGGSLADEGTGNVALVNNGGAVNVAGADGAPGGAFSFAGAQSLSATDAGLPAALATRSYGCWFKATAAVNGTVIGWGTISTGDARITYLSGTLYAYSGSDAITGPYVGDGQWHFVVVTEDNAAGDGVRRKLYLDGRLVGASTAMNALTLAGANRFRLGAHQDGTGPLTGQIDGAFVSGVALTAADVAKLYAKGSQALAPSPKEVGAHVEAMDAANVLATFDTLDSTAQVTLGVAA